MLVGILSDTHDNLPMIRRALSYFEGAGADCLIHAGDFVAPFALKEIVKYNGVVYAVFGNNDGERAGLKKILPDLDKAPRRLKLCEKTVLLVHDEEDLSAADRDGADVIVVGHTHQAEIRVPSGSSNGRTGQSQTAGQSLQPMVINPGEAGGWLTGEATVATLDTETLEARIVKLGKS
jgi:uncharacterized protein